MDRTGIRQEARVFQPRKLPKFSQNPSWLETSVFTVLALSFSITASLYAVDAPAPATPPPNLVPLNSAQGLHQPPVAQPPVAPVVSAKSVEPVPKEGEKLVAENTTDAKRIAELQEIIIEQTQRLTELKSILESPESEYAAAESAFRELKQQWERLREALERAIQEGNRNAAAQMQVDLEALTKQVQLAQDRFDLAIEERKNAREEWLTLQAKLKKDQEALQALTGEGLPTGESQEPLSSKDNTDAESAMTNTDADEASSKSSGNESTEGKAAEAAQEVSEKETRAEETKEEDKKKEEEEDEELAAAKEEAETKAEEAEQAEEDTESLAGRIADLQKLIAQQQKEIALARKKFDLEVATQATYEWNSNDCKQPVVKKPLQ